MLIRADGRFGLALATCILTAPLSNARFTKNAEAQVSLLTKTGGLPVTNNKVSRGLKAIAISTAADNTGLEIVRSERNRFHPV